MRTLRLSLALLLLLMPGATLPCWSQETVTIPKARLEELERKEAELDKLKGDFSKTKGENMQLKKLQEQGTLKPSAVPPSRPSITHTSPTMSSLPPLSPGEIVDSMDLANYYRVDPAAADIRFRKRTFGVQGEIVAFEKPPFIRDYRILLKTGDRDIRVIGNFSPPESYSAVLTVRNGSELVGQRPNQNRVPIAKVGDRVIIEGRCSGLKDGAVRLADCELKSVR